MAGEETTNQGNVKQEYNLGTTGLNLDNTVNQIEKGSLSYALNASVENFDGNSINYQNEPGNEHCLDFPAGYQLIGEHSIYEKNKHIFFLASPEVGGSEIGYMDNNDCIYHTLVNADCLNFNINNPIHKAVHKITNCTTEIYWTDGYNPRRYLDIDNIPYTQAYTSEPCALTYTTDLDCNQLSIQPNFTIPQLEVTNVITGGSNIAGTIQFSIQYSDAVGNGYTSYYSVTNPTPIADPALTTPNFNYEVGKSVELTISNLDMTGQFQYYNLAVIKTINAIPSVELVGTYFIDSDTNVITYSGQNVTQIRLTQNDIFEKFPYYEVADDITSVQDILVWDGLTSIDKVNYQQIANQIVLNWETYRIPNTETYADELNATNLRGYMRDEVYAFEIVFLLANGKQTDGFHIPGRVHNVDDTLTVLSTSPDFIGEPTEILTSGIGTSPYWKIYNTATVEGFSSGYLPTTDYKGPYQYGEFAYWESTDTYPCNELVWGDLSNQPIRHHKFPDVLVSPIVESALFTSASAMVMQKDALFPIGVKLDVSQVSKLIADSNLTQAEKNAIAGFKIVRGDRSTNRSIVAKGILRNVGAYNREGTDYYYPNYPYNDIKADPFLLNKSNAYTGKVDGNTTCRNFTLTVQTLDSVTKSFIAEYTDCTTGLIATITSTTLGAVLSVCTTDLAPVITKGKACIISNTYIKYKVTGIQYSTVRFTPPAPLKFNGYIIRTYTIAPGDTCTECANGNPNNYICKFPPETYDLPIVYGTMIILSLTPPEVVNGTIFSIAEVERIGYDICNPQPLNSFTNDANLRYRQVFNSPETSFGQPFLGDVLKLENVIFGAGKAHFVQVRKNALNRLISREAQTDAVNSSFNIAGGVSSFNASSFYAAYQAYLTIYINGITRRNYSWSFNSIASYDYTSDVINGAGIKQRPLDIAQYLIPGVQSVGDNNNINNWQRESSVYLKTTDEVRNIARPYNTYKVTNNDVSLYQTFQFTNIYTTLSELITIPAGVTLYVNSLTTPIIISGGPYYSIIDNGQNSINVIGMVPTLPFPENTLSINPSGSPIVTDNSRFVNSSSRADCNNPGKLIDINVISYYASLKNIFINQWGQIYSYNTIDTGFQRDITPLTQPLYDTVFGGDTFIGKFALKTKLPFFIDNRVGAPDDSDIYYDEIGNVAYPQYWWSSRSELSNVTVGSTTLNNFISVKAHNLDCPNSQGALTDTKAPGRTFYDGKMYQFAYGIPYFYCESGYNIDLRQAFNNKEGDFWPHVSTNIPDDWVQESNVTIAQDNTYYYNVTFSKQNKENFFSHLPIDWKPDVCYTYFPFRTIYSETANANPDIRVNNWLTYTALATFDFPQNYGKLISLDGIQNKAILARFENKSLLYNTMLTIDTSNPQAAYMGNDSLFRSSPPIDFAETDLGYVGTQNKMLLKIPQGQITIDAKRGQVFLIAGNQAQDLSAIGSGLNRFFTEHLAFEIQKYFPEVDTDNHFTGCGLHGTFDSKYERVIITKLDYIPKNKNVKYDAATKTFYLITTLSTGQEIRTEVYLTDFDYFCNKSWTLTFNMNTKSWVSFHSYIPNWYIAENNFFYSGLNDCCSDIEAIVARVVDCTLAGTAVEVPLVCGLGGNANLITTTTTTTLAPVTTTTTTTVIICTLAGTAVNNTPATTTTTTTNAITTTTTTLSPPTTTTTTTDVIVPTTTTTTTNGVITTTTTTTAAPIITTTTTTIPTTSTTTTLAPGACCPPTITSVTVNGSNLDIAFTVGTGTCAECVSTTLQTSTDNIMWTGSTAGCTSPRSTPIPGVPTYYRLIQNCSVGSSDPSNVVTYPPPTTTTTTTLAPTTTTTTTVYIPQCELTGQGTINN